MRESSLACFSLTCCGCKVRTERLLSQVWRALEHPASRMLPARHVERSACGCRSSSSNRGSGAFVLPPRMRDRCFECFDNAFSNHCSRSWGVVILGPSKRGTCCQFGPSGGAYLLHSRTLTRALFYSCLRKVWFARPVSVVSFSPLKLQ